MKAMRAEKEHLLDLLVDGELNEADRRELLLWCERDPEGWRRCAMAFLEAESWSKELAGLGPDAASAIDRLALAAPRSEPEAGDKAKAKLGSGGGSQSIATPSARSARPWRAVGWSLAMAASFLVSFALGLWARGGWLPSSSDGSGAAPSGMVAGQKSAEQELMDKLRRDGLDAGVAPAVRPQEALGQVRLVVDGPNGSSDEIQLPIVEGNFADADFLRNQPSAVPLEVQRVLERMGHRVQQRRELVPLRMQDGRRLIVPVDEVEVHPVGNRAYQ